MMQGLRRTLFTAVILSLGSGCKKAPVSHIPEYMSTLNAYYTANPSCLWPKPQQLPFQVSAADTAKNAPLQALVDVGLLMRTSVPRRIVSVAKDEIDYDLTAEGRAAWTPDSYQPGLGNFCYGTRTVQWIGHSTPNNGKPGATTLVVLGYAFNGAPDWVKTPEIEAAFPQVHVDLDGTGSGITTATLVATETGWEVQSPPAPPVPKPPTAPDPKPAQ